MLELLASSNIGQGLFVSDVVNISPQHIFSVVYEVLVTLFLFTKSDLKTIFLPVMVSTLAICPHSSPRCLALAAGWIWLHLLQFTVSNQTLSVEEDAANKPWRPLPARRISLSAATSLRWFSLIACLLVSLKLGVFPTSVGIAVMTLLHNEAGLHSNWAARNICCGFGYMLFQWGATSIASPCHPNGAADRSKAIRAIILSGFIIATTIQAQDFKDVLGDRIFNRSTMPIVWPRASRVTVLVAMAAWSLWLPRIWGISSGVADVFGATGLSVGLCCYLFRSVKADQFMYILYNLWLAWVFLLPSQAGQLVPGPSS